MQKKKLFFLDLDGTLFKSGSTKIDENILNEVESLKKQGHKFVVNTGRSPSFTLIIDGIEHFDYISCMLGNIIFLSNGRILHKFEAMNGDKVLKLAKFFEDNNILWTYKDDYFDKTIFSADKLGRHKAKFVNMDEFLQDAKNNNIYQIMSIKAICEDTIKVFPDFDFFNMPDNFCDITIKGSSKAKAIKFFKQLFPDFQTVSFGDSENDIAMFENSDISIAMGNSATKIQSKATFVTKPYYENGIVYAFKNILNL
ncbi:MAG: HAD-IIB family hydrolase [Christensenellales bacterium]